MNQCCGEPGGSGQAETQHQITDLGHAGIGQHTFDIVLENRDGRSGQYGGRAKDNKNQLQRHALEGERRPKHAEHETHQSVNSDLCCSCGKKSGYRRRRIGISVGQPKVQWKHRELNTHTNGQKRKCSAEGPVVKEIRNPPSEICHVQRTGHHVEHADSDQDECRADGTHDEVLVRRGQGPAVPAHRDQYVTRQR